MLLESPHILCVYNIHNGFITIVPDIIFRLKPNLWSSEFMLFNVIFILLNCAP